MRKPSFAVLYWGGFSLFLLVIFGSIYLALSHDINIFDERSEYCKDQGYEKATKADKRLIDGQYYVECFDEQILNKTIIEREEWIVFTGEKTNE